MLGKLLRVWLSDRESSLKFKLGIKLAKLGVHQRGGLAHVGESEGGDEERESAHRKFLVCEVLFLLL